MSMKKIIVLKNEIEKSLVVLSRLQDFMEKYRKEKVLVDTRGVEEAMVIAQSMTNYYTCVETIFLRISRFFENNLSKERWHQELLERMTVEIEGIRKSVITDDVRDSLAEILKFRHFTRYYFELNYDWDKLDFILKKFDQIKETLPIQIRKFLLFLDEIATDK